ncbi:PH domain-containing protein [Frigoribacterium sp. VKM Ac-1396]|jgi:membrane protein YdbS with pleckstrin-like domain|uniref:PH domain-containing protein n=1 Tax=Frigoribacterium sp. VKM Ac-1396 TaxID=2783821 RepID=UPI00188CEED5|nr:PH domain-containing protein [Frigoribacterium sp. VKM Ac-1396]MBF4602027.1 PH domain-containing protein [Frigoribacterium sp. VKM Ac-1396]
MDRLDIPDAQWTGVSPKYVWPELVGYLVTGLIVAAATAPLWLIGQWWTYAITAVVVVVTIVVAALTPRRVRAIGYQLREDDLLLRKGILFLRVVAVPYGRMQLIDINRGPVVRALGLSDLKFVTAAAASAVTIPGVPADEAERLRDRLVELAESRRAGL